ncbi:CaiB/BaiF CoA transferase family protein [Streptomyces sp. NPDC056656]|uniref:CaiB/BaiF CoA transferase family protein n=1 Tax=Streptomyces sp. NPDC056656 TaxID=3345895 RepID=UPI0036A6C610
MSGESIAPSPDPASEPPLAGLRVVDMTIWMAGPVTGMLLADLGADVVKVESTNGDPTRSHTAPTAGSVTTKTSISYSTFNRNKRSIALDLSSSADRGTFDRMIEQADVFITNMSPTTVTKLGIDADSLHAANPRLVYARGSGLGPTGPRANDLTQDMTGMAYAGMLFALSPDQEQPFAPPGALNDVITGTYLFSGVLAALLRRARTGRGETVTGSLLQSALWTQMGLVGSVANTKGASTTGRPRTDPRNALLNQYRAGDGRWIAVAAVNARAWDAFVTGAQIEHLVADPRFATYADMLDHSREMRVELDRHFATQPADHWLERLREHGVWCGPVNRLGDVLTDEQVAANHYLTTLSDGLRTVSMPFTLDGFEPSAAAGPDLDADRDAVLRDWGVDSSPHP